MLPSFPRYVDIELTNICNFRCLMCPTGTGISSRKKGHMSRESFYRLVEELKNYRTPVRFIGWGEPLLHPDLLEFLDICKNYQINTHLNTNGLLLNEEIMDAFVSIPLTSLKFSFQGVDRKSYREMRNRDFFDELLERIKILHYRRGSCPYPYIHVATTITYESIDQVNVFKKRVLSHVDLVTIGRTKLDFIDIEKATLSPEEKTRLKTLVTKESVVKIHPKCPEVFNVLAINWDGSVSACCADHDKQMIVGDIREGSLKEIWKSKKMNTYRKRLSEMKHDLIGVCSTCYDMMSLQEPGIQGL